MDYDAYATAFLRHRSVAEVHLFASLSEGGRVYDLIEARVPGRRTLLVTAGFHGDEVAGPLTLLESFPDLAAYARARGVGLRVFPLLNPSGFEDGTRYNRSGEQPNNDFLRYEVTPEHWVEELPVGQTFLRWVVFPDGPKETRALRAALERGPAPDAALDLHQDPWLEGAYAYAYTFGARTPYLPLVERTAAVVPLARGVEVDDDAPQTDEHGLIEHHDGSITDWMFRRDVPFTAALETTTRTPLSLANSVNLIWLRGFIDLCANRH